MPNEVPGPGSDETQSQNSIRFAGKESISGDLFLDKASIRLVFIERTNHVVAIRPRVVTKLVFVIATRVSVFDHVQPVPRPALAIVL